MTFAPRYSPDSRTIVFSMAVNGNTDIYRVPVAGGTPQRLTNAPGIDTGGSYSPDGGRIVFESDRGGIAAALRDERRRLEPAPDQLRRRRATRTPVWSPRGDLIAFTKIGGFRIGVMSAGRRRRADPDQRRLGRRADLGAERPGGDVHPRRQRRASSGMSTWRAGRRRRVPTPLGGSDPAWSPLRN